MNIRSALNKVVWLDRAYAKKLRHANTVNWTSSDHEKISILSFSLMSKLENANRFCPSAATDYKSLLLVGNKGGPRVETVIKNTGHQLDYLFSWLLLKC